ncbi:hypothetical protein [Kitasatospora sp. GP82]|uniref:hypothetical protein n=1 Tax=Kitasatospora sp. GP82 TaxID=3035089 RepID=UPI0024766B44|nr:hypothetical protein [Kitasatospora sp. GP82]MDH6124540.1 hypothetical protein [Kitasatospora sp. GP82]
MSTNRSRRIDRDSAEQLLGGAKVGTSAGQAPLAGHAALAGLLAAAAAPADADGGPDANGVLPGEEAALAAFREARRNPAPQTRRRTMADTATTRAFSAKAVAVALVATALGGVAVAAGTGHLPAALGGPAARNAPVGAQPTSGASDGSAGRSTTGSAAGAASGQPGLNGSTPPATSQGRGQSPSVDAATGGSRSGSSPDDDAAVALAVKLCHLYADRLAAGAKADPLSGEPALAPLAVAAGGADRIEGYCTAVAAAVGGRDGSGGGPGNGITIPAPGPGGGKGLLPTRLPIELPTLPAQAPKPSGLPGDHGALPSGNAGDGSVSP